MGENVTLLILLILAFAAGIFAAVTRTPPPSVMEPLFGVLMIGVGLMNAVAAYREPAYDRRARLRHALFAGFFIASGIVQLIPKGTVRMSLQIVLLATIVPLIVLAHRSRTARQG